MAKSKVRKKAVYTPPVKSKVAEVSPRWLVPTMVGLWLIGLAWIAVFYVTASTGTDVPFMSDLHNWNLGIGFTAIILGVVLSTRWR
ncbi:cell division protein CrgA [Actinomadura roseirufa]|uniref:cell division protein CrgA n=1 Tax=Actinomadura roseirufa TaxID=2094049 RepID=UPI00104163DF|nr:cell division protein CrgA [Actinomadura roseirufa]